jgi:hypothetical protein
MQCNNYRFRIGMLVAVVIAIFIVSCGGKDDQGPAAKADTIETYTVHSSSFVHYVDVNKVSEWLNETSGEHGYPITEYSWVITYTDPFTGRTTGEWHSLTWIDVSLVPGENRIVIKHKDGGQAVLVVVYDLEYPYNQTFWSPYIKWGHAQSTAGDDILKGVASDSEGNLYTVGYWEDGIDLELNAVNYSVFLSKYDAKGFFQWRQELGSARPDYGNSITTDTNGYIYVAGTTQGNVNTVLPYYSYGHTNDNDAFVAKYSADGRKSWVMQFGTSTSDVGTGIVTDGAGSLYVTGTTRGSLEGYDQSAPSCGSNICIFIAKWDVEGNKQWVRQLGPVASEDSSISIEGNRNICIAGQTYSDLDLGTPFEGLRSFIIKYDEDGTRLWTKYVKSIVSDIVVDRNGDLYATGIGNGGIGNGDVFVAKYDINGDEAWVRYFGSFDHDIGMSITTDVSGNIYVTGSTHGNVEDKLYGTSSDIFVAKYDLDGNMLWAKQMGSAVDDFAQGIAVSNQGSVHVVGNTKYNNSWKVANFDAFLIKLRSDAPLL